jgi:GMC oxidoreductase
MYGTVVRPKSRGQIRLTGPSPDDPIQIESNTMSHPDDLKAAVACVELCREIANSAALRPFTKREVIPGNLRGAALEDFIRDETSTYHHQTCTAKMGRDSMSVVDGQLKVYGIENLRNCRRLDHAARAHRQCHGYLHRHRRMCRRDAEERAQVRDIVGVARRRTSGLAAQEDAPS